MSVPRVLTELRVRLPTSEAASAAVPPRARDRLVFLGIAAAALALRLAELGEKPLHHDESSHAWLAWLLFTGEGYEYNPVFHGPLQFYLYTLGYFLLGVGEVGVRLLPALVGAGLTLLPWALRDQLGRRAALVAAALLAISPSFLYFSRFAREDIFVATLTLAMIVVAFKLIERPARWQPPVLFGLLAASFATKETTFITVFVAGSFFLITAAVELVQASRAHRPLRSAPLVVALRAPGGQAWIWAAASFALVFTILFSTFLVHPQGLRDGLYDGIDYWLSQQPVNRGSQPWFYYLVVIPAYELPIVVAGLAGVVVALRRPTLLRLYLVWHLAVSLAVYSWASERMPWLVLHPLLPLVLLAGIGIDALLGAGRAVRRSTLAAAAAGVLVLVHGATAVSYDHPADPAELLVFTQNSVDVHPVRDTILALDRRTLTTTGEHPAIAVDDWGGTSWPWILYFRDLPVEYVDMSVGFADKPPDIVVLTDVNHERIRPFLTDYTGYKFHLREWWVVDYGALTPRAAWRWFLRREPWNDRGAIDQWLYVRKELLAAGAASLLTPPR